MWNQFGMEQLEGRVLLSVAPPLSGIAEGQRSNPPASIAQPFRRHYTDYAPAAVSAYVLHATIKHVAYPFASHGTFTIQLARRGNTYQIVGGPGVADSHGTYRYTKIGFDQGSVRFTDSVLGGGGTEALTFTSAHAGIYVITAVQGGYQSGTFTY